MRAEAMATYTRSLLEPLVAHVAVLETTIRELERENGSQGAQLVSQGEQIGTLRAELEALRAQDGALERSGAPQAPDADPPPALLPPTPWWSAVITIMVFATMGALVLLLAWPK
jgi:hypothetical protein